jgi:osmoprotectant transport system substrate-binding protein
VKAGPGRVGLTAILVGLLCAACGGGPVDDERPLANPNSIRIGSFDFSESVLVSEIYAQALESRGYPVTRGTNLGSREILQPALQQGAVDLVPEYLGSALTFVTLGRAKVTSEPEPMHRRLSRVLASKGIETLAYSPAQDQNGIVVTELGAARYGLRKVSDLQPVASRFVFGGPPECPERPFCLSGLQKTYGLTFKEFQALDSGGPATVAALEGGDVDVALLFTTDPMIVSKDFVLLRDDRGLQPAENIVPMVREEVFERHGRKLTRVVNRVTSALTTKGLRALNHRVQVAGASPSEVAADWLDRQREDKT